VTPTLREHDGLEKPGQLADGPDRVTVTRAPADS
jgi:hypothetical protein